MLSSFEKPVMYNALGHLNRNELIKQFQPLVKRIAHLMMAKLPANIQVDDLIQVGLIGLTEALTRYESIQGVKFETFATQRIRGAMLDELRDNDWMSRGTRKSQKEIEQSLRRLEHRLGRTPLESEIALDLGLSLADYQILLGKVRGTQLIYLEDMSKNNEDGDDLLDRYDSGSEDDPMNMLRDQRLRHALIDSIKKLPEREQFIMSMYYEQDMNLKEIALVLDITESRVCQLHSQAIARLRAKMRSH